MSRNCWRDRILIVAVTSLALVVGVAGQQPLVLDLSAPPPRSPDRAPAHSTAGIEVGPPGGVIGGAMEGGLPPVPFAVTLESLTPAVCMWGEEIQYEVTLTNTSTETLQVPWSPALDAIPIDKARPDYHELVVSLFVESRTAGGRLMGSARAAYGSPADARTLQPLAPRRSIRIRAAVECRPLCQLSSTGAFKPCCRTPCRCTQASC